MGIGFKNDIMKITKQSTAYDLVLNNAQAVSAGELSKLDITKEATYQQKSDGTTLYYNQADFDQEPLLITDYGVKGYQRVSGEELVKDLNKQDELRNLETPERQALNLQILNPSDFAALNLPTTELKKVIQVEDFDASIPQLQKKLVKINEKKTIWTKLRTRLYPTSGGFTSCLTVFILALNSWASS